MRNFRKKYFRFCANCAKKQRKTAQNSLRFMRKNSAKVREKKNLRENSANFAQKIQPFRGNPNFIPNPLILLQTCGFYLKPMDFIRINGFTLKSCFFYSTLWGLLRTHGFYTKHIVITPDSVNLLKPHRFYPGRIQWFMT